MKLKKLISF
jgi:hypothetical protein